MNNLASAYRDQERWELAGELQAQVMHACKGMLGSNHLTTLQSMSNLASTYGEQGRWEEAEELEAQILTAREAILGPEHPDTLTSMSYLATAYCMNSRLQEAVMLQGKVMAVLERCLETRDLDNDPSTLMIISNLVPIYSNQGHLKEGAELGIQVMGMWRKLAGPEHPATLVSMFNLAATYRDQERFSEAEK